MKCIFVLTLTTFCKRKIIHFWRIPTFSLSIWVERARKREETAIRECFIYSLQILRYPHLCYFSFCKRNLSFELLVFYHPSLIFAFPLEKIWRRKGRVRGILWPWSCNALQMHISVGMSYWDNIDSFFFCCNF